MRTSRARTGKATSPKATEPTGKKKKSVRKRRARPTPRSLTRSNDLDELAKRRCLMVLSVLSGNRPVTDVIEEAKISRQAYYQLEDRAIQGMLMELGPSSGRGMAAEYKQLNRELEKLKKERDRLEQDKRRLQHLLLVTRKVIKSGPLTLAKKSPRKRRCTPASGGNGTTGCSDATAASEQQTGSTESIGTSIPTRDSGVEHSSGTEN